MASSSAADSGGASGTSAIPRRQPAAGRSGRARGGRRRAARRRGRRPRPTGLGDAARHGRAVVRDALGEQVGRARRAARVRSRTRSPRQRASLRGHVGQRGADARQHDARGRPRSRSLLPPLAERLRRRLRQLARHASTRRAARAARPANGTARRPAAQGLLRRLVAPAAGEHAREQRPSPRARRAARRPPRDDAPAQVDQHLGDVDLDRADLVAGAAQRRGVGQRRGGLAARASCGVRIAPIGPG